MPNTEASKSSGDASKPPAAALEDDDRSKSVLDTSQLKEGVEDIDEALLLAAGKGMLPLAQTMLELGANPNASVDGITALQSAAACGGKSIDRRACDT